MAPAATVSGRDEVTGATRVKSLLPVRVKELMVAGALPELVSTTDSVLFAPTLTLPKASVVRFGVSDAAAPVPVRPTVVVVPPTPPVLEVMVSVSVLRPADPGTNWIRICALPPGRMLPAVDRTVKPDTPPTAMLAMSRLALPALLMVKVWVALEPRDTVPKLRLPLAGTSPMTGMATPVPVSVIVVCVPLLLVITRVLAAAGPPRVGA